MLLLLFGKMRKEISLENDVAEILRSMNVSEKEKVGENSEFCLTCY